MLGLDSLDVDVTVVLGKTRMPLHQLLLLGRGAVVALDPSENDEVDILANDLLIARGAVVVTGDRITVEVVRIVSREAVCREPGTPIGGALASPGQPATEAA